MTDGIGRLSGFGNYGVGGYVPQRKDGMQNNNENNAAETAQPQAENTQIDPTRVMDLLSRSSMYIATPTAEANDIPPLDEAAEERIAGYMEHFEMFYGIVKKEFGEEVAPEIMDFVMDKFIGMSK